MLPTFGSEILQEIIRKELEAAAEIIKKGEGDDFTKAAAVSEEQIEKALNTFNFGGRNGTFYRKPNSRPA